MALPNGSGGYQVGSGNFNEVSLGSAGVPQTATNTATLTAAQITGDVLVAVPTANSTLTLPTGTQIDDAVPSARVGSTFDLALVNAASFTSTLAVSTGVTNGGNAVTAVAANTSAMFRFRKTGDGTYVVYKIA